MKTTAYDYHSNPSSHGSYQFETLKSVVDGFYMSVQDDDHLLKNTKRAQIIKAAKNGIKKLNLDTFADARAMEITVPENLSIALPHNYVDYLRVSVVVHDPTTDTYRLKTLNINTEMNIAEGYLQDHNWEILFDEDGQILTADSSNVYNKKFKTYLFDADSMGGQPQLNTSKLSAYGEFVIDKQFGRIAFSSDLSDKEIVMEYISDGLQYDTYGEESIKINKYLVESLNNWIYFSLIEHKGSVAQNEKTRALNRYKTTIHKASIKMSNLDMVQIERVLRSSSKNP